MLTQADPHHYNSLMDELTPGQQQALRNAEAERTRAAVEEVGAAIDNLDDLCARARAADDVKSAERLERSLAKLRRKQLELETGVRPA